MWFGCVRQKKNIFQYIDLDLSLHDEVSILLVLLFVDRRGGFGRGVMIHLRHVNVEQRRDGDARQDAHHRGQYQHQAHHDSLHVTTRNKYNAISNSTYIVYERKRPIY